MPRRHVIVFMLATILLLVLEIGLTDGMRLVHVLEVLGVRVFLYLAGEHGWSSADGSK